MSRLNLKLAIRRDQDLTTWELRSLYKNNVCNLITDEALSCFTPQELKRHIGIILYKRNIFIEENNRSRVIAKIAGVLFVTERTVRNWCPSRKSKKQKINAKIDSNPEKNP